MIDNLAVIPLGELPPPVDDFIDDVIDELVDAPEDKGGPTPWSAGWAEWHPSGLLADLVAGLPVAELDDFDSIEAIKACERLISHLNGVQAELIAHFAKLRRDEHTGWQYSAAEIGAALRISGNAAGSRIALATDLADRLPTTWQALRDGAITSVKASAISETTATLDPDAARRVEDHVLKRAPDQTPARLRACLRRAVLKADPDGAHRRHEQRREDRRVEFHDQPDGMGALWASMAAHHSRAIYDKLTYMAKATKTPDDTRTMDQRRADALVELCLGVNPHTRATSASGDVAGIAARVQVTVPAGTLLGLGEEPGELAGYGPIPAEMARELAADGTWRRLLTDPASGALLDYGRTTYRPPAGLADFVRARDGTCRFPGCRQPAWRSDLDHVVPWPQGPTSKDNMGPLCRRHHDLKQQPGWSVERHPDGRYTWTAPTGHMYTTPPPDVLTDPPRQPDEPEEDP